MLENMQSSMCMSWGFMMPPMHCEISTCAYESDNATWDCRVGQLLSHLWPGSQMLATDINVECAMLQLQSVQDFIKAC